MIEMAKCRCGEWLSIVILRDGATAETCDACGYRQPLRSRARIEEPIVFSDAERERRTNLRRCAWPEGCDKFAAARKTDFCPAHCDERRKLLNRAYAKAKYDLRVSTRNVA